MRLTHEKTCVLFRDSYEYEKENIEWTIDDCLKILEKDFYWKLENEMLTSTLRYLAFAIYNNTLYKVNIAKFELFQMIVNRLEEIYIKKNTDYGDSFKKSLEVFGIVALRVRLYDKAMRLKTLLNSDNRQVKGETIEDTVMDFINYCIMGYMELNNMEEADD